jgi:translation initiation factor IF-1
MPGVTARSAAKNISRGKRSTIEKNNRRCFAALCDGLEFCTYGKIVRTLGNKMFTVINTDKEEHLSHIRGKMARISVGDIVLLNVRDYESRAYSSSEVYDIMAVFESKDVKKLRNDGVIPGWMTSKSNEEGANDDLHDLFEYGAESESESESDSDGGGKKRDKKRDKKDHRAVKVVAKGDSSDVDIDKI